MKTIEMKKATEPLAEYARNLRKEPVIFTASGKPVAALVSTQDADLETIAMSLDPRFMRLIERSRRKYKAEGGISSEEMRRRLGMKKKG